MRHLHKAWDIWTKHWLYKSTDHWMQFQKAATLYWIALSMLQMLVCLHWLHSYELWTVVSRIKIYNSWKSSYFNNFLLFFLALSFHIIAIHSDFSSVSCHHITQSSIFSFFISADHCWIFFSASDQHLKSSFLILFFRFHEQTA